VADLRYGTRASGEIGFSGKRGHGVRYVSGGIMCFWRALGAAKFFRRRIRCLLNFDVGLLYSAKVVSGVCLHRYILAGAGMGCQALMPVSGRLLFRVGWWLEIGCWTFSGACSSKFGVMCLAPFGDLSGFFRTEWCDCGGWDHEPCCEWCRVASATW